MAVIIGGIRQETNTFCGVPTTLDSFLHGSLFLDQQIIDCTRGTRTGEGAFLDVLTEEGLDICPTVTARASSGGRVAAETYCFLRDQILMRIQRAGKVDAVLLNLHGAMVSENCSDTEGDLLSRVRELVGPDVPIGVSLDAHAFVTPKMLEAADVICGYQSFPHVDEYETGLRAARLLTGILRGSVKPVMTLRRIPMILPPHGEVDSRFPMRDILDACLAQQAKPGILDITFFPVQPWMDIPDLASAVLVISDDRPEEAASIADQLAQLAWDHRRDFSVELVDPNAAVAAAARLTQGTVALSEAADAPPAGAPGDGVALLRALLEEKFDLPAYVITVDPSVVELAYEAGEGSPISAEVGHHNDPRWGKPVHVDAVVSRLIDDAGYIAQASGVRISMGRTAVLRIGRIVLGVCSHAFSHIDPRAYEALGLEPENARILGVKSTLHFHRYYRDITCEIHLLDSAGPSTSKFTELRWEKIPHPMWPMDEFDWSAREGVKE